MRKIIKLHGLIDIPMSLRAPFRANFPSGKISKKAVTTAARRHAVIRNGAYSNLEPFNSRYRQPDIKKALKRIYLYKCAYCEQRGESFHVEHYRPKSIYFWLAYSWDNLLWCCPLCNSHKNNQFRIDGPQAEFKVSIGAMKRIHRFGAAYDATERPELVNPEVTDPTGKLIFEKNGGVSSTDHRFQYTIDTCKLDRDDLQVFRLGILRKFREDIESQLDEYAGFPATQEIVIKTVVAQFVKDARRPESDFTAFRAFVVQHWLADEIKRIKNRT